MKPTVTVELHFRVTSGIACTKWAKFSCTFIKSCPYCKAFLCVDRFGSFSDFVLAYMFSKVIRNPYSVIKCYKNPAQKLDESNWEAYFIEHIFCSSCVLSTYRWFYLLLSMVLKSHFHGNHIFTDGKSGFRYIDLTNRDHKAS